MTVAATAGSSQEDGVQTIESVVLLASGLDGHRSMLKTLMEISREIPDNVNHLTAPMAEYLAGRFLKGLNLCGELYSLAIRYEGKMEIEKRREFSQAMLVRSAGKPGIKTAKEKEMWAFLDEEYCAAADKYVESKMFRLFVEEKKDSFGKAHYLVRKIVDREQIVETTERQGRLDGSEEVEWSQNSKWSETQNK